MTLLTWPIAANQPNAWVDCLGSTRRKQHTLSHGLGTGYNPRRTRDQYVLPYCPESSPQSPALAPIIQLGEDEHVYRTISPQTTSCRYNPLHGLPVRKPSLPATSSLQSSLISCNIEPASCVCSGRRPNRIHFPIRVFTSDSHRGLSLAVAAASAVEELQRASRGAHCTLESVHGEAGAKRTDRSGSGRRIMVGNRMKKELG